MSINNVNNTGRIAPQSTDLQKDVQQDIKESKYVTKVYDVVLDSQILEDIKND